MSFLSSAAIIHNRQNPSLSVPIPHLFGRQKGRFYFKNNPLWDWSPAEIEWVEGIILIPAPISSFYKVQNGRLSNRTFGTEHAESAYFACVSKYPITNAQFRTYLNQGKLTPPTGQFPFEDGPVRKWVGPFVPMNDRNYNGDSQPVVCVAYDDATSYCKWLNRAYDDRSRFGGTAWLPSGQLWDYLAYGSEYKSTDPTTWLKQAKACHHRAKFPAAIDSTGDRTNSRGFSDMFGNVWEWCAKYQLAIGDKNDLSLPGTWAWQRAASKQVTRYPLRGGCYLGDMSEYVPEIDATTFTDEEKTRHTDIGFRIVCAIHADFLPQTLRQQIKDGAFYNVDIGQEGPDPIEALAK